MGPFAMQIARLESSFHAGIPRERKSSWENKRMYDEGSGELYAAARTGVNNCARRCELAELWITVSVPY
jgi:hypothetical protein